MAEPVNNNILIFLVLYLFSQWVSQLFLEFNEFIPVERNYVGNFVNSLVLVGIVLYIAQPKIVLDYYSLGVIIVAFILALLFSFSKLKIQNQTDKEKLENVNKKFSIIQIVTIIFYSVVTFVFIFFYSSMKNKQSWLKILLVIGALVIYFIISSFAYNRGKSRLNLALGLYLYPILFLSDNTIYNYYIDYFYCFFFASVSALFGFNGVEYFIEPNDCLKARISRQTCKAVLGIDDQTINNNLNNIKDEKQNKINSKNIKFLFVIFTFLIIFILLALGFVYRTIS